jgi:hypothetical protein
MAADIGVGLFEHSERLWRSVFTTLNNSLVYIDDSIAEILHWSGRTLDIIHAGAIRIQSIENGLVSRKNNEQYTKSTILNCKYLGTGITYTLFIILPVKISEHKDSLSAAWYYNCMYICIKKYI